MDPSTPLVRDFLLMSSCITVYHHREALNPRNFIICTVTGERNVHLDLNPWWWAESSTDILRGVETLSYEDPQVK
jgi:hypothetical protein